MVSRAEVSMTACGRDISSAGWALRVPAFCFFCFVGRLPSCSCPSSRCAKLDCRTRPEFKSVTPRLSHALSTVTLGK